MSDEDTRSSDEDYFDCCCCLTTSLAANISGCRVASGADFCKKGCWQVRNERFGSC